MTPTAPKLHWTYSRGVWTARATPDRVYRICIEAHNRFVLLFIGACGLFGSLELAQARAEELEREGKGRV